MPRPQHSDRYKQVCALLKEARKKKGLTQAVVAVRLGKPQSFVSKYESGERRLDVVEFIEIAAALGASAGALLNKLS